MSANFQTLHDQKTQSIQDRKMCRTKRKRKNKSTATKNEVPTSVFPEQNSMVAKHGESEIKPFAKNIEGMSLVKQSADENNNESDPKVNECYSSKHKKFRKRSYVSSISSESGLSCDFNYEYGCDKSKDKTLNLNLPIKKRRKFLSEGDSNFIPKEHLDFENKTTVYDTAGLKEEKVFKFQGNFDRFESNSQNACDAVQSCEGSATYNLAQSIKIESNVCRNVRLNKDDRSTAMHGCLKQGNASHLAKSATEMHLATKVNQSSVGKKAPRTKPPHRKSGKNLDQQLGHQQWISEINDNELSEHGEFYQKRKKTENKLLGTERSNSTRSHYLQTNAHVQTQGPEKRKYLFPGNETQTAFDWSERCATHTLTGPIHAIDSKNLNNFSGRDTQIGRSSDFSKKSKNFKAYCTLDTGKKSFRRSTNKIKYERHSETHASCAAGPNMAEGSDFSFGNDPPPPPLPPLPPSAPVLPGNNPLNNPIELDVRAAVTQDEDGDLPLHIAAAQENLAMVQRYIYLMKFTQVSIDTPNNLRQSALHIAVITGNRDVTDLLVSSGACPDLQDRHGNSAVHLAVSYGEPSSLTALLKAHKRPDWNLKNYDGLCAAHLGVQKGRLDMLTCLLDLGCDVNAQEGKGGRGILSTATELGHPDMVDLLLSRGANVNSQNYSGTTALHIASSLGNCEIAAKLVRYGADTTLKNSNFDTPLSLAKNEQTASTIRTTVYEANSSQHSSRHKRQRHH